MKTTPILDRDQQEALQYIRKLCTQEQFDIEQTHMGASVPALLIKNAQGHLARVNVHPDRAIIHYGTGRKGSYTYPLFPSILKGIQRAMREYVLELKNEAEQEAYEVKVRAFEADHADLIADLRKYAYSGRVGCIHETQEIDAYIRLPVTVWKEIQKVLPKTDDQ